MARLRRIPALVDVVVCDDAAEIRAMVSDAKLDRDFRPAGPLLNRLIAGRIRRVLVHDGRPLPPVSPRAAPGREASQSALKASITARTACAPCDADTLEHLAALILSGADAKAFGPVVQTAIGRLFRDDFTGTAETWQPACLLDAAMRSNNPLQRLRWRVTGEVEAARGVLAAAVQGNAAALHAIGIAAHNMVAGFVAMGRLAATRSTLDTLPAEAAASRCLVAPARVLRQAAARGETALGSYRPGTLIVLELEAARARTLRHDTAFLTHSWSACPAHAWVPALLAAAWGRAGASRAPAP